MVKSRHHDDLTTNPFGEIYDRSAVAPEAALLVFLAADAAARIVAPRFHRREFNRMGRRLPTAR